MANLTDKINAARQEGYSDDEIITHLSSTDLRDKIEAARQEGYSASEIADFLGGASAKPQEVSSLGKQFAAGMESNTELPGQSLEEIGKSLESENVTGAGSWLRGVTEQPENFVSATERFINPKDGDSYVDPLLGFGWGNLGGAAAEQAGQMTGDLLVRGAGATAGSVAGPKGAVVGALAGPAILEFMRTVGPIVKQRMEADGRTEANWEDWVWASGTAGASGALNAIGIKNIGVLNNSLKTVGTKSASRVAGEAAVETGKKAVKEGSTETGQSVITQIGGTANTEQGTTIDLKQAVGEGILGTAAGGTMDAARNVPNTVRNVRDINIVDNQAATDPYARDKAEITDYVNKLAERETQQGNELQSAEITSYVNDLKNQAAEVIRKQRLKPDDQKALMDGLTTAKGLTDERLNEIAGRSESPDEIKALAHRIQLIRGLTVQQQARKGWRGWAASGLRIAGIPAGYAIDAAMGSSGVMGSMVGGYIGRDLARDVSNRKTQGARIDALVGAKQARRARLLLERYGPSDATKAMNTLTERAAAKEAEAQEQAQVVQENARIASEMKAFQKRQAELMKAVEQAKTREEKAKAQAEKKRHQDAHRELRMQSMALDKIGKELRNKAILEKLETQQTMNALTVEATQVKTALATAMAAAKAEGADRKRDFDIANMKGKLEMLSLQIERRQEALKKAQIATRQADKLAAMGTPKVSKAVKKAREVGAAAIPSATVDQYGNPIANETAFAEKKAFIQNLQSEGMAEAENFPDRAVGNIFIEAIRDFQVYTGRKNQAKRMEIYANVLDTIPNDVEARRFVNKYIRPLAFAFAGETGAPTGQGREDFGSDQSADEEIPF